jgi:hypothetical protein
MYMICIYPKWGLRVNHDVSTADRFVPHPEIPEN